MPWHQQQQQLNVAIDRQAGWYGFCLMLARRGKDVSFSSNQQNEQQKNCPHPFSLHMLWWIPGRKGGGGVGGVDGVCLAVNDEVLICCWREYGYPTLSDMQSYNLERKQFTNTALYLKYLHPQISKLFCDGIESTSCLLFLKCFFFCCFLIYVIAAVLARMEMG